MTTMSSKSSFRLIEGQPPIKILKGSQLSFPIKTISPDKLKQKEDNIEIEVAQQGKLELQGQQKMVAVTIQQLEDTAPIPTTDNNKGKTLHEKKETMEVELLLIEKEGNGFKFGSSKDMATSQVFDKAVKEHKVHKYAGKDLLTKRQIHTREGAQKSR